MSTDDSTNTIPWITDAEWASSDEGQLAVDVVEEEKQIIIRSAIAGVDSKELDVSITSDTVTIRGERKIDCKESETATTHIQECHWGGFSRSVVLPAHVNPDKAKATMKNGILTITLPKTKTTSTVEVKEID